MTWVLVCSAVATGLFFSAFFSGAETGLYCINRLRLHLGVQQRQSDALRLARVLHDEQGALCVALIGTNVFNYITTAAVAFMFVELLGVPETRTELYTVALVTPVIFVFGEVVPKNLFQRYADVLFLRGGRLFAFFDRLLRLSGVVWMLTRLAKSISRAARLQPLQEGAFGPKRRVAMLLREALAGRTLGEEQSDLIERVCRISETPLHRVMVPRNRVRTIAANADRRELLRVARKTRHARLPMYEQNPRRITGVVRVDLLLQSDDWQTVGEKALRPVTFGPHESVASAMTRLQRARRGMAVITDHAGRMLGIVTLNDLLQEVVGELAA